jgi:hypothetical protein
MLWDWSRWCIRHTDVTFAAPLLQRTIGNSLASNDVSGMLFLWVAWQACSGRRLILLRCGEKDALLHGLASTSH